MSKATNATIQLEVGGRLPALRLERVARGGSVDVRRGGREASGLLLVSDPGCSACHTYVADLANAQPAFEAWNGRILVIIPGTHAADGDVASGTATRSGIPMLKDPGGLFLDAGAGAHAALLIADRFGDLYLVERIGEGARHALPDATEIEEWFRYLATQCPECGVPDEPGKGEWEL